MVTSPHSAQHTFERTLAALGGDAVLSQQWDGFNDQEGELSVDIYQDRGTIYVTSTIAGVKPDDLELSLHNDMLTIRGIRRQRTTVDDADYFYHECFWGKFSRSIILPIEVEADKVTAELANGVLTIALPKRLKPRRIPLTVHDDYDAN